MRYTDTWPHGEDIPFYSDFNVGHAVKPWIQTEADLACFKHVHRLSDSAAILDQAMIGRSRPFLAILALPNGRTRPREATGPRRS